MEKAIRVLLLEDSAEDAELIVRELRRAGYTVEAERVETGEALREALAHSWDVLLADHTLPAFDAPRALALLRELALDLPVIIVSGSIRDDAAVECLKNGAADYLHKDRLGRLGPAVEAAIRQHQLEQEHRRANAEIREREEMYRRLYESMAEGILYHAANGRILSANPSAERILGTPSRLLAGHVSIDLAGKAVTLDGLPLHADSQPHVTALRTRQAVRDFLMGVWNAREKARRWVLVSSVPLFRSTERAPYQAITTLVDVTERRRIEEDQAFMATAIEQAAESFVITDTEGIVKYANPTFTTTTGYERGEIIGHEIGLITSEKEDPRVIADLWATIRQGRTWHGVVLNRRKDGTDYQEEITVSPVRNAAGTVMGYVSAQRDVTKERELQLRLQQAQKMDAVGRFATGIAHDFNNILQAITGFNDMACEELDEEHPVQEHLHEVASASEKAAGLIRQLLAFGSRSPSRQRLVNPGVIVADLVAMLRRVIDEDIAFDVAIDPAAWMVAGDPAQIEQAVMNLCVNARDAMPDGGTLTLRVENVRIDAETAAKVPTASEGCAVRITVGDNGPGMSAEARERIFEPFFKPESEAEGAGLCLATVYSIVKKHGGFIRLDSEPGRGSTFHIYLSADDTRALHPSNVTGVEKLSGGSETILLAEDDEQARRLAVLVLENAGYTVLAATNGEEALELFNEHRDAIAAAVLDVIMPGKSGKAVFEAMRSSGSTIPVLFMTGYSFYKLDSADASGEQLHLLMKPFGPRELLTRVQAILHAGE